MSTIEKRISPITKAVAYCAKVRVIVKCSLAGRDLALEGMKFLLAELPCDK